MIEYSTNLMGPINEYWYQEKNLKVGTAAAGRIDIYGLDETEYYGGMSEYDLPPMSRESWEQFSDWLEEFETEQLWSAHALFNEFEKQTGYTIEWL